MRLLVKLKTGEEALIVGYALGKKGRPMAIVVIKEKLRAVKLRDVELVGFAKIQGIVTPNDERMKLYPDGNFPTLN